MELQNINGIRHVKIEWELYLLSPKQYTQIELWHWVEIIDWQVSITDTEESNKFYMNQEISNINLEFEKTISKLKEWYSESEIAMWDMQYTEALRVEAWATWTMLENILVEWETEQELAETIIRNSQGYYPLATAALKKKRQAIKDLEKKYSI